MFLFLVLGQPVANAQTAEAPQEPETLSFETLTLSQAVAFALQHAPQIQEAELTVALAELDLKRTQFWRRLVPNLTLHHGYNPVVGESRVGIGLSLDLNQIWEEASRAKAAKLKWFNSEIYRKTVKNQVIADVEGILNLSQQPIAASYDVLGVENANSLVVYDSKRDRLYTVGTDNNANIYPKRIHCRKGEPIVVHTQKVHIENELLGNLVNHLPQEGKTFIKGTLKTTDRVILPQDPETFEPLKPGINEIELQYARAQDLAPVDVQTLFVISGDFYLRTILPASPRKEPTPQEREFRSTEKGTETQVHSNVHTTEMYIHHVKSLEEIRVKEGQDIQVGDLIAELSDPQDAQRHLLEGGLIKQATTLTAQTDPVAALFLADARSRLEALKAEREHNRIISTVNGRVLLIRTHAIQNHNRTIAIKLLVREP
jgi:hypothetical protein